MLIVVVVYRVKELLVGHSELKSPPLADVATTSLMVQVVKVVVVEHPAELGIAKNPPLV